MDSRAWASDLGKATRMHSPGAGSLLSLVCVVEQGSCRQGWLVAAVHHCRVLCLHAGGVLASSGPFVWKWQLCEGCLGRLYVPEEAGHGGALSSQQDCGGQRDRTAYIFHSSPSALERVSHSRVYICTCPFSSLLHFTYLLCFKFW